MRLLRNYDPLQLPNDPEWKYYWAARSISSPDYVGAKKAQGYQTVPAKEAEKLGYDPYDYAIGGMVDKANNVIGPPDLVLMRKPRAAFEKATVEKNAEMMAAVGKKTTEFEENAERAGLLLTE